MQLQIEGVSGGFHEKMTFGQNPDRNKAASHSPTEGQGVGHTDEGREIPYYGSEGAVHTDDQQELAVLRNSEKAGHVGKARSWLST